MKKEKREGIPGKAISVKGMAEEIKKQIERDSKIMRENEGRCVRCNKNKADLDSPINSFFCEECNGKIEEILQQLKGPGFMGIKFQKKK